MEVEGEEEERGGICHFVYAVRLETVERYSGNGIQLGQWPGKKIFVLFTAPGK